MNKGLTLARELNDAQIRALESDDEHTRVEISFSSETLVPRWFGDEVLDHSPEAVDLDRLNNRGAVLVNHDWDDQVGVIERAWIGEDRRGFAEIRFSRSARGREIAQDVLDGIRTLVSTGYQVLDMVLESREEDKNDTYRVTRWAPFEVSFVSVPADPSVGYGREFEKRFGSPAEQQAQFRALVQHHDDEVQNVNTSENRADEPRIEPGEDHAALAKEAAALEGKRVARILTLGQKYGLEDEAQRAVSNEDTIESFQERVLAKLQEDTTKVATKLDMDSEEVRKYSLVRAINAAVTGNWQKAGLERQASQEIAKRLDREPSGFFVPHDVQTRAQDVGTSTKGGELVESGLRPQSFIDYLYAKSILVGGGDGATMLPGLVGDVDIPKRTGAATFYWVAEDGDITDSDGTFGLVQLSPKTVGGAVPITRKLLKQSTPAIDGLVLQDLGIGAALAIDKVGLEGGGINEPDGITQASGVNTVTITSAGSPDWDEIVDMEAAVDTDNALMGSLAYMVTPAVYAAMRKTAVDSGSGIFLVDKIGYPILRSTQLAANRIIFGNRSDVLIGMWGVLDVMPDTATKAASGGLVLRVFQDVDVAVRHAESFCINA